MKTKLLFILTIVSFISATINAQFKTANRLPVDSTYKSIEGATAISGAENEKPVKSLHRMKGEPQGFSVCPVKIGGMAAYTDSVITNIVTDNGTLISFTRKLAKKTSAVKKVINAQTAVNRFFVDTENIFHVNNPENEIRIKSQKTDELNKTTIKGEQIHNLIPIYGTEFTLNSNDTAEHFMGRLLLKNRIDETAAKISAKQAVETAKNDLAKTTVFGEFTESQKQLFGSKPRITVDTLYYPAERGAYQLTYKIIIFPNFADEWHYYVNAVTGNIADKYNNTKYATPATATATDDKGQQQTLDVVVENGVYYLVNISESMYNAATDKGRIMTYDDHYSGLKNTTLFSSSNNQWTNTGAVSGHANAKIVFNYMKNTLKRNSWDNQGGNMIVAVNLGDQKNPGVPNDNAFWNGMGTFFGGGGENCTLDNLARSLDCVGHEFGHGIVQSTADLEYKNQSGAINETYADIFGAMAERANWQVGEDIVKKKYFPSGAMRDFANPHNGGSGLQDIGRGWQPAHMSEMYIGQQDNGGVHINSGIGNHAFYQYAVSAGREKAEQVFYKALTGYLTKTSQFIDLRIATMRAAKELYGDADAALVGSAFDKVGVTVNSAPAGTTQPDDFTPNTGTEFMLMNRYNANISAYCIQRTSDGQNFQPITDAPSICRLSVTDNGAMAVAVAADNKIYLIDLSTGAVNALSSETIFATAAISKDGKRIAAVTNRQDALIYVFDISTGKSAKFQLYNPNTGTANTPSNDVKYAEAIEFDNTGEYILYDSFNSINSAAGQNLSYWDIGVIRVWNLGTATFGDGKIVKPFGQLPEGTSIGNPTFAKNSSYIIAFDYLDKQNQYGTFAVNFNTGKINLLFKNNTTSFPVFGIKDNEIAFTYKDDSGNPHIGIVGLSADKMSVSGNPTPLAQYAYFPYLYGNGTRVLGLKPQVSFVAATTQGAAPLEVTFQDMSANNPTAWLWEFEGGVPSTSTQQFPKVTYSSSGSFKVKLTASNSFGSSVLEKSNYINTDLTPVEEITKDPVKIQPNPATDYFIISGLEKPAGISIFDISGKIVVAKNISPNEKISITHLSKGVYMVKVNGRTGKLVVK